MIRFLFKGIWRDGSRSKFPVLIVSLGVMVTVFMIAFLGGVFDDMIELNAELSTGHVKVTTHGFHKYQAQLPLDLAISNADELQAQLKTKYPGMSWAARMRFSGVIGVGQPNTDQFVKVPATAIAVDLIDPASKEIDRMNIPSALVNGQLPNQQRQLLISAPFAERAKLQVGDSIQLYSSGTDGNPVQEVFQIAGTVSFGNPVLDKGGVIMDITSAQSMFEMNHACTELLGFFDGRYNDDQAIRMAGAFNAAYDSSATAPVMIPLRRQNDMGSMIDVANSMQSIMVSVFILAMSLVLWNVGLLGGIRRYKEFGLRLALGEPKRTIFSALLVEGAIIGTLGSIIGTCLAVAVILPLSKYGISIGNVGDQAGAAMMIPSTFKPTVVSGVYYLGFIPGLGATLLGQALSGIGIFKRDTAKLFKELEV